MEVILVDEHDVQTGTMEKMEVHQKALLHRAFSVFIFNEKGEMLLHKRADKKYHSGGLWTNACCSHPKPGEETLMAAVMLAAFLGHLYPVFFDFKGGKGVATALGVSLGVNWLLGVAVLSTWLLVYKLGKISSLSALVAAIFTPVYAWFLLDSPTMAATFGMLAILLLWRHKRNIQNLLAGNES